MADFYEDAARQRFSRIEADRAQALADLQSARATGDVESAAFAVQQLADLDTSAQNLTRLHSQYVASQNPPAPPELSAKEKASKPLYRMNWADALELARASKYGKDLSPNDPLVLAGMREVQARRGRGE